MELSSTKIKRLTKELEAEKEANIALNAHNIAMQAAFKKSACLIGIETFDRVHKFTFHRNEELYAIETYSTMGDNVAEWKEKLGIK